VVTAVARELAGFVWAVAMRAMGKSLPERRHRGAPRAHLGDAAAGTSVAKGAPRREPGPAKKAEAESIGEKPAGPQGTKGTRVYVLRQFEKAGAESPKEKPARRRVAD